ncbi:MAG: xylose isomerase [Planctomycetes bacterium]|nr:xylose isomerase [Planctomycetota bacterium]MCB9891070.1 xylose isomerase [Planctomycetota bacterium]MCB9916969.1 xylose isomerase [Planctomycetota bacterium]
MDDHESAFAPTPDDKFTFGLWTVGNRGRDPFGDAVRPPVEPTGLVRLLAECGAYGVNLHDNDLVPFGASASERDRIVRDFRSALEDHGLCVPMATTNLFYHPIFKDGAFTSNDPAVRAFALQKTMRAIDLGAELGARIYVFWGGREGTECDACRDPRDAIRRFRDALDFLCGYVVEQGYGMRFALEAKPNEPRGDIYLPTTGHLLHFIETLAMPEMVGVNPEVAHETMAGLSFPHAVAQALEADKLFHIDLNSQKVGRYDQDFRFASEDPKQAFLLVRLLEGTARAEFGSYPRYDGPKHFDAHAYRSEDEAGVRDFARGCMRSYKILAARAEAFDADSEVLELLTASRGDPVDPHDGAGWSNSRAKGLRDLMIDVDQVARRGLRWERLDQLLFEHLTGVRD